ncbi:hypothetical protein Tco_1336031 [Tanacetum coccineum]
MGCNRCLLKMVSILLLPIPHTTQSFFTLCYWDRERLHRSKLFGYRLRNLRSTLRVDKSYFDRLGILNMVIDAELSINIILSGLPTDYNQFVLSYQMNRKETSIMELHSLLQTAKQGIKNIDVPSTLAAPVLTIGHNAKKRKTYHSN